jgi:hypothetical protein
MEEIKVEMNTAVNDAQNPEVHHHDGKKRFKEYLQEGLMIFVAVTLGFLAENIRENIGNKEKANEYISSYLHNLQDDTAILRTVIGDNLYKVAHLDSLMSLSLKDISATPNRVAFYKYCFSFVGYYSEFSSNDATFLQLTNSGGLRLIKKDHVADSIAKYASVLKEVYAAEALYAQATDAALKAAHELLDYSIMYDSSYFKNGSFTGKFIPLISDDHQKMKFLFNKIYFEKAASRLYADKLISLQPFLSGFIQFLRKEYPNE